METPFESGQKIQYRLFDKKGKEHWFNGVIHAVKRYEDAGTNMIHNITYLIDTGRDERVDTYMRNPRGEEVHRRAVKLFNSGKHTNHKKIFDEVMAHDDLPPEGIVPMEVRQPEQIELPAEHIRVKE